MRTPSHVLCGFLLSAGAAFAQPGDYAEILRPADPWTVLEVLASDGMAGRGIGEPGGKAAREYLAFLFRALALEDLGVAGAPRYERPLALPAPKRAWTDTLHGGNVCGWIRGTDHPERYLVITAHFDHLGDGRAGSAHGKAHEGAIHNGADDNASGVAALYALARHFRDHPPRHSVIFLATDGEELGLEGARQWVAEPPVPLDRVLLNVNLDMVARADNGKLWAVGTRFHEALRAPLAEAAAGSPLTLHFGHDARINWTGHSWLKASDHWPFHRAGVPFLYFGVDDHGDYHRPTDDLERIDPETFAASVALLTKIVQRLDRMLDTELRVTEGRRRRIVETP